MEKITELINIKQEVSNMSFTFKNVHRIMFLIYETKHLLETSITVPNKDIALHQTNKVIQHELISLIQSDTEVEIKAAFEEVVENFKLVLAYTA